MRADKLLLKRVLANLVENGIHAGQEAGTDGKRRGRVARRRATIVTITVDDHGKGVADDSRDKIFEPYVTTKATGTGLGLAIARKIAIEHGGELVARARPRADRRRALRGLAAAARPRSVARLACCSSLRAAPPRIRYHHASSSSCRTSTIPIASRASPPWR